MPEKEWLLPVFVAGMITGAALLYAVIPYLPFANGR